MAGAELRDRILRLAGADSGAKLEFCDGHVIVEEDGARRTIDLRELPLDAHGYVASAEAHLRSAHQLLSTKTARVILTPSSASARTGGSESSISNSAPSAFSQS